MDSIGALGNTAVAEAMLLRAEDGNEGQSLAVLKKAMNADKSIIEALLPPPATGSLDIKA